VFGGYLFLCLAYSGLGIRFKETLIGPLIAAFIIWTGGPLVVALEFHILIPVMIWLLVGSWLVYISRETLHTIDDYEADRQSGYRTLAVRVGKTTANRFKYIAFGAGIMFLLLGLFVQFGAAFMDIPVIFLWAVLLIAVVIQIVAGVSRQSLRERNAYWLVRLFYVLYAAVLLQLNPFVMVMFVWVFVTSKRS
jgi:4-hydroxybenzoate polyprenyltransferase